MEPRVFDDDDNFEDVPFPYHDENDDNNDYLATRRVCSLGNDDDDISI